MLKTYTDYIHTLYKSIIISYCYVYKSPGLVNNLFLLNIYLNYFNGNVLIICDFISAHPHLNVVSGGLW